MWYHFLGDDMFLWAGLPTFQQFKLYPFSQWHDQCVYSVGLWVYWYSQVLIHESENKLTSENQQLEQNAFLKGQTFILDRSVSELSAMWIPW